MRKNLGVKPYFYPMPVLVIGTYNEDGTIKVNGYFAKKMCTVEETKVNASP